MASPSDKSTQNAATTPFDGDDHVNAQEQKSPTKVSNGHQPQTVWMEDKSQMLDEVDQLVELMEAEKLKLTDTVSSLEAELQQASESNTELSDRIATLESCKTQMQSELLSLQNKLKEVEEKSIKESLPLKEALTRTKKQLKDMRTKAESLGQSLDHEKAERTKLDGSYNQKHKKMQAKLKETSTALQTQCSENMKLTSELAKLQEKLKSGSEENAHLKTRLETLQQRHKYSQDEVLALKGRLTISQKAQEQLQLKCSALGKSNSHSPPPVVKVVSRSKEELKLSSECKRKDELLSVYIKEMSVAHKEQERLENELCVLQQNLTEINENNQLLKETLEAKSKEHERVEHELQERLHRNISKLQALDNQESDFSRVRKVLEEKLHSIEGELRSAMEELNQLRRQIQSRDKREKNKRTQFEQEKHQAETLVKASREMMEHLSQELATTRLQHSRAVENMASQWEQKLREAEKDYDRLKEASTRRCAELAKEVWELKSRLSQ